MKKFMSLLGLATSMSTLVCCALPASFVILGFGASFAGLVSNVPQLIWISENKMSFLALGGIIILAGGILQWKAGPLACPVEKKEDCMAIRDWSKWVYLSSVLIYAIGAGLAI